MFSTRSALVVGALLTVMLTASPASASPKRAANYGYDYSNSAINDDDVSMKLAADKADYYQSLRGFSTMTRYRGLGDNIYTKLAGTDPDDYGVLQVVGHGASSPRGMMWCAPKDGEGMISCWYEGSSQGSGHTHGGYVCQTPRRVENLSSVPYVRWVVYTGCLTADETYDGTSLAMATRLKGVDTVTGFRESMLKGMGSNGQYTIQNFTAKYWKSLYQGARNSEAMRDGYEQVKTYHGSYMGFDSVIAYSGRYDYYLSSFGW